MRTALLLALQIGALWPAIHWYAVRTRHASEDRWELIALIAAAALVLTKFEKGHAAKSLALPAILTLAWALGSLFLPPLLATWLAWTAIVASVSALLLGRRMDPHLFGLASLSLPILPLFQYHLSYPLRTLVAELSAMLLRFAGVAVARDGACLAFDQQLIWVDAPCSGLRMMWSALFLAISLAALHRLTPKRTAIVVGSTLVLVIAANVLRTTALFYVEAELFVAPEWVHPAAGIAVYVATAAALLFIVRPARERSCPAIAHS